MANRFLNVPMFLGCLSVSAAIGGVVHLASGLNFWASWGIVLFAWVGVGISTFFDDPPEEASNRKEKGN